MIFKKQQQKQKVHTCSLSENALYAHTQQNPVFWNLAVILVIIYYILSTFYFNGMFDNWFYFFVFFFFLFLFTYFSVMTIVIDDKKISINFLCPKCKKNFYLKDIKEINIVKNKWWYGWGMRKVEDFMLYNVYGLDAVELIMKDGSKTRIGTGEPKKIKKIVDKQILKNR